MSTDNILHRPIHEFIGNNDTIQILFVEGVNHENFKQTEDETTSVLHSPQQEKSSFTLPFISTTRLVVPKILSIE